jgi:hypothetical protein
MTNLLGEPPETLLPADPGAQMLAEDSDPRNVASLHPDSTAAWITLSEAALDAGQDLEGYAFARTGYHRSLDLLRRNGWKGFGPVPWSHEPNQPFLRSLAALGEASARLGDDAEAHRCREFLHESSPEAYDALIR